MEQLVVRNPFWEEIQRSGISVEVATARGSRSTDIRHGRPTLEEGSRPSAAKSVRLPITLWRQLGTRVRREKTTINAAMRQAAHLWLRGR